jgi:PAS domain S-box-containing protein
VLIRRLTGFDRVMIYRFDDAWNGEVLAEACVDGMEPYLGLHFPASDIPKQARDLFQSSHVRQIPDTHYFPSTLFALGNNKELNLGPSALRSVSPLHIAYLKNMGVRATLVGSLVLEGRLWGLVSCQQKDETKYFDPAKRDAIGWLCEDLAALFEVTLVRNRREREHELSRQRRKLVETIRNVDFRELLRSGNTADLLGVVGADGFALLLDDAIHITGRTPDIERIRELQKRRLERGNASNPFSSDALVRDFGFEDINDGIAGALFVSVLPGPATTLIWFREERCLSLRWGGDPEQAHSTDAKGQLSPRKSFALFLQEIRGKCRTWTQEELDSAAELGSLIEIEALRERDARLSYQHAQLRTLLESIPYMVWMKDREGTYLVCNAEFERFFGAREQEIVGKTDYDFVTIEQAELFRLYDCDALGSDGHVVNEEWVTYASYGHQALMEITNTTVRDAQGKLIGVLGVAHDITERKRQEVQLQLHRDYLERMVEARTADLSIAKESAEEANREKSHFIATLSQELRTPLNDIMDLTEMARHRASDPQQIDHLDKVGKASQQILAIISDILDISGIEADKLTLQ